MSSPPRTPASAITPVAEDVANLLVARAPERMQVLRRWSPTRYGDGWNGAEGSGQVETPGDEVVPPIPSTDVLIRQIEEVIEMHARNES